MNVSACKKVVEAWLRDHAPDQPDLKVTARTVHFTDLARASCVFVKIHGWKPCPIFPVLQGVARRLGFRVEVA